MRRCRLYPVYATGNDQFSWEWRAKCGGHRSARTFTFFHDCMEDARSHGFAVELQRPIGDLAPARHSVRDC